MNWLKDTLERVGATAAEVALALMFADGVNILAIDWKAGLGVVAASSVASFLKAVVARQKGDPNNASLAA